MNTRRLRRSRTRKLTQEFGEPAYQRIDAPAAQAQKQVLKRLSAQQVRSKELAGDPITSVAGTASGNDAPIDG
jgi:phosphoglucomutase